MDYLSRDAILAASDLPTEDVAVPEWGGTVRLRSMTAAEYEAWDPSVYDEATLRARLVAMLTVDAVGAPLFTDADVAAIGRKSVWVIRRLADVAARLSKLGAYAEDLKGNFDAGQPAGSSSSSPASSEG